MKTPGDFAYIAFPMACPPDSHIARRWLDHIEAHMFSECELTYNVFMTLLAREVQSHGLEHAIAGLEVASPFNRLHAAHAGLSAKRHLFDVSALDSAMCVNNVWQTTMSCTSGADAHSKCNSVAEHGSIWSEVVSRCKVIPHKRVRYKAACPEPLHSCDGSLPVCDGGMPPCPSSSSRIMADKGVDAAPATADKCVGESVWGDPFVWRTIMDMP